MSVKKDPSGKRWVQAEVEIPGTPEQVWEAIATGPGVSSWFVPTDGIAHFFALAMGGQVFVSLRFYLYGEKAAAAVAKDEPVWQAWLQRHFMLPAGGEIHC